MDDDSISQSNSYRTIKPLQNDHRRLAAMAPEIPEGDIDGLRMRTETTNPFNVDIDDFRIRWIHFVLGCTTTMPWNVLIVPIPYFLSRLQGSPFEETVSSYLSLTYMVFLFISVIHATLVSKSWSPTRIIRWNTRALFLLTLLLTLSTFSHFRPASFFKFILLVDALQACASSYYQSAAFSIGSLFGSAAIQSLMTGQAAVGVVVSVVQLVTVAFSLLGNISEDSQVGPPEVTSARIFFTIATCYYGVSFFAHRLLARMPAYKVAVMMALEVKHADAEAEYQEDQQPLLGSSAEVGASLSARETITERVVRIGTANITYEIALAYAYLVTLAVFPPITSIIAPTNPSFHMLLFSAVHFLMFSVGDFIGRYLCSFPSLLIWSPSRLLSLSLSRTLFIPLFLACNLRFPVSYLLPQDLSFALTRAPLINSDVGFFFLLLLLGTSNGYISTMCLMAAPSLEHNAERLRDGKHDVDTAATICVFTYCSGLAMGSLASFGIRGLLCRCNPFVS